MSVQGWTFLIVGFTFAIYIGIAIWTRAKSTKEFYVAGGQVPGIANGMATAADWMSAASFISMAGLISFMGRDGGFYLMGWTGGYVLLALLLAPYLRKFGKFTVPDFVGDRYYSKTARVVAVVVQGKAWQFRDWPFKGAAQGGESPPFFCCRLPRRSSLPFFPAFFWSLVWG